MTSDERTMESLHEAALHAAPRLFALYGLYSYRFGADDDGVFLGWGMEFDEPAKAIMWDPDGSTFISGSADQLLSTHNRLGDAHLVWLTGPDAVPVETG
ncbi:hypothetical protein [Actinokineospora sp.]|uniref:hypothetical protein n=1 Tax=Actinokineospora sp. TaxID=1872133 RepID=UPI0040383114